MIIAKVFSQDGQKIGSVQLDIRKSDAGFRLQNALFIKGSGIIPRDLERLDAGDIPISTLRKVYTTAELKGALIRHTSDLRKSADEADAILGRLDANGLWTAGSIRKSYDAGRGRDAAEVVAALEKYSYKDVSGKRQQFVREDGHSCSVKPDDWWRHSHGPSGKGAAPLVRLLSSIHGDPADK